MWLGITTGASDIILTASFRHQDEMFAFVADELAHIDGVTLLADESATTTIRGRQIQIVGVDPRAYARREARPDTLIDESVDLSILLCHFPGIVRRIPQAFHLILAGHYHAAASEGDAA